ncbi:MAG: nitrous oxide reductase family maturation protein NosD, partial [Candidatus Hermodarchaeota archaeon]
MKSNAKSKIIILITLGILFALAPVSTVNPSLITGTSDVTNLDKENLKISATSGKIHIINNSGWVDFRNAGNCTGNGTYSEPYVIEDLIIDGGGSDSCILIENSNVYFKIENCTVYNSGYWDGEDDAGIKLQGVSNGTLISNNASYNYFGIILAESNNNTISGNTANNNALDGIALYESNYNTISGNTASNNTWMGIILHDYGIGLSSCNNNNISGNIVNNNHFGI